MEKYGTYRVYEDEETGKIIRKAFTGEEQEKLAEKENLKELEEDPQDKEN